MLLQFTRGLLIGAAWREAGEVFETDRKQAEHLVRSGAANPVAAAVQKATLPPAPERAVHPRQAAK
jgi:hypothetical protein